MMSLRLVAVLAIIFGGAALSLARGPLYSLLVYLWLAYFRPETWVWQPIVKQLGSSFYFGAYTVLASFFWGERFFVNRRVILMYAVVAHSLIATLLSPYFGWSWPFWSDFIKIVTMAYMIPVLARDTGRLRLILLSIVLSLGLDGAKQGYVFLVQRPGEENMNQHMMFGDNNAVGAAMLMLLPFVVALAATATRKWEKLLYQVMIPGLVYRALVTFSRGAFLTAGAVGLCYLLRSRFKFRAAIAVVVVGAMLLPVLPDAYWERMQTIVGPEEPGQLREQSSRGRLHFWNVAVDMANANPIFGVGHNAYNLAYDKYNPGGEDDTFGEGRAVHSQWFGILGDLGYPGLLMFIALYASTILGCERVRRRGARDPQAAALVPYAIAVEVSMVAAAVGGTFLTFQYVEMIWHTFGLGIAVERLASAGAAVEDEGASAVTLAPQMRPPGSRVPAARVMVESPARTT